MRVVNQLWNIKSTEDLTQTQFNDTDLQIPYSKFKKMLQTLLFDIVIGTLRPVCIQPLAWPPLARPTGPFGDKEKGASGLSPETLSPIPHI